MKINLLDCTLRDGGYYNNWDFKIDLINDYLRCIASSGIQHVEIGFRSFEKNNYRGACAYSKDEFLSQLNIPNSLKIAVMVNASEIINYKKGNLIENTKKLFKNKKKSKIVLVRVATHYHELSKVDPIIKTLKKLGYKVGLNLMQISEKSDQEIIDIRKYISEKSLDILYFADSMGSLEIDNIQKIIKLIKTFWKKEIGIHTHDNMSRAIINSRIATNNGVTWVDSTVTGMGRGPGNAQTEYMILEFKNSLNKKINVSPLIQLKEKYFDEMKKKYKWGTNIYYFLSGLHRIHPTFIQRMLEDVRFTKEDILSTIGNLKSLGATSFKKELLSTDNKLYKGKANGSWSPALKLRKKEVLILGNGPSIKENRKILENYIQRKKPYVIGLNTQKSINEKLINLRAVCNELRFLTDIRKLKKVKTKMVLPLSRLSKDMTKFLNKKNMLNFGLQIKSEKFQFYKNYAILPNSLAISYALSIACSGKAKKILLAGFDGFPSDDPRRLEMDNTFELFRKYSNKIEIISVTSTKYNLKSVSIYAL
mgnify:CR=1 FL=1|tara:strand:- start:1692 stop:3299 length:1608 start_codon:yes stop_codon:yes gene_type:complete